MSTKTLKEPLEDRLKKLKFDDPELFKLVIELGKGLRDKEIVDEFAEKHGLQPIPPEKQL